MGYLPDPVAAVKFIVGGGVLAAAVTGGLLYSLQNMLIYPANLPEGSRTDVPTPDEWGMPFEELTLVTSDSVRIKAFMMKQRSSPGSSPTILLLHANAGNVGCAPLTALLIVLARLTAVRGNSHRLPIASVFYKKMNCNVLALSYRGYGHSEGKPSEAGLRIDSQTALDHILSDVDLEKTKVFLYGQSIGGAVAIDLASRNAQRLSGVIVENTFLSLPKLVPVVLPAVKPFLGLGLLHQIWPSEDRVPRFPKSLPVLYLSGERDELVPPSHMQELYEKSGGQKTWKSFPAGTHNDTCTRPGYFDAIATWLAQQTGGKLTRLSEKNDPELVGASAVSGVDIPDTLKEKAKEKLHKLDRL